jgi:L-histidine N-alpha-methyltransferase
MTHHRNEDRFTLVGLPDQSRRAKFAQDVAAGLAREPKRLPCCYFYDQLGSVLFEAICATPEYYLTRAETALLGQHAEEIAALFPGPTDLIELGSGNASKTRLLIDALLRRQVPLRYVPLDICRTVLEESSRELLRAYPTLLVLAIAAEYHEGLSHLHAETPRRRLVIWLGSNIGNLERAEAARFLARVRETLRPYDKILIGVDLRKDRSILEAAYDDAAGVTAAFNRNILARINRELGGDFDPRAFRHRAVYEEAEGRIEMYLVAETIQRVKIEQLQMEVEFATGEAIHTENSYKYSTCELEALAAAAGLRIERPWKHPESPYCLVVMVR